MNILYKYEKDHIIVYSDNEVIARFRDDAPVADVERLIQDLNSGRMKSRELANLTKNHKMVYSRYAVEKDDKK